MYKLFEGVPVRVLRGYRRCDFLFLIRIYQQKERTETKLCYMYVVNSRLKAFHLKMKIFLIREKFYSIN